ncbi:MAG: NADH-quinone oxidoreductase subunit K, partial [Lawsonibacter sp.]|nr:NADH-quinone oxidoreductase subunit K [Lawsonibacter sp.]
MLDLILRQRFYIGAILLFSIGLVTLFLHPNLIKKIIGLNLMDTSVFLFLAAMGYVDGGRPPILDQSTEGAIYINPVP